MPTAEYFFVSKDGVQFAALQSGQISSERMNDNGRDLLEERKIKAGISAYTVPYEHNGREGVLVIGSSDEAAQVSNLISAKGYGTSSRAVPRHDNVLYPAFARAVSNAPVQRRASITGNVPVLAVA